MLQVQGISKSYGSVHALKNVSLDLKPGLFGLLGPNGAGKSTLMKTLATLQLPDQGQVLYDGVDIAKDPTAMRNVLGYLPQDFGVYPKMSAVALLEHIAVLKGLHNKKERDEQIRYLLKSVNLWTKRRTAVSTYSGGMRQRFGVAQAMLGDPKVLIVDEPTAGLDPFERQRFLDLLSEAGDEKIIILSTHIVEDIRDLCPDMAIMGEGEVVARGAPEALIDTIRGCVFRKEVDKAELADIEKTHKVLSTRRRPSGVIASVYADSDPGDGFKLDEKPVLQDAYFAHLYKFV